MAEKQLNFLSDQNLNILSSDEIELSPCKS